MSLINIRSARARALKEHVFNWKSELIVVSMYMESVLSIATYYGFILGTKTKSTNVLKSQTPTTKSPMNWKSTKIKISIA